MDLDITLLSRAVLQSYQPNSVRIKVIIENHGAVPCFDLFENQERIKRERERDGYNDNPITALYCYSPFTFA